LSYLCDLDERIVRAFPFEFHLSRALVCMAYMGSASHNTYVPKDDPNSIDDVDMMGIAVPPPKITLGLKNWEHWIFQKEELDVTLYSITKFIHLLLKCNPNVVGLLWLRPEHYLCLHPAFQSLIRERSLFSSKIAYDAFSGYADAQIKKMETLAFQGYMGAKRKALVERFGYDTKNAAHAIRLLRMGAEFLETGVLTVFRDEDAEEIRAIKRGEWSLEEVKREAERGFQRLKSAYERSALPEQPDYRRATQLLTEITLTLWREMGEI
jgi:hypothetical protein